MPIARESGVIPDSMRRRARELAQIERLIRDMIGDEAVVDDRIHRDAFAEYAHLETDILYLLQVLLVGRKIHILDPRRIGGEDIVEDLEILPEIRRGELGCFGAVRLGPFAGLRDTA